MKPNPKEKLNNKAHKMIDLILDEIKNGGSKTIAAGFTDENLKKNYVLTVGLTVNSTVEEPPTTPEDVCKNCSCNTETETTTTDTPDGG